MKLIALLFTIYCTVIVSTTLIKNSTTVNLKKATVSFHFMFHRGNGVAIKYDNKTYILTNQHICTDLFEITKNYNNTIKIIANNAIFKKKLTEDMVIINHLDDLCLLKSDNKKLNYFKINKQIPLYKRILFQSKNATYIAATKNMTKEMILINGEKLLSIGQTKTGKYTRNAIATSLPIIQGDSGSPVLDQYYELSHLAFSNLIYKDKQLKFDQLSMNLKQERSKLSPLVKVGYITYREKLISFLDFSVAFFNDKK